MSEVNKLSPQFRQSKGAGMRRAISIGALIIAAVALNGCASKYELQVYSARNYLNDAEKDMLRQASDAETRKKNCLSAKEKAGKAMEEIVDAGNEYYDFLVHEKVRDVVECHAHFLKGIAEDCLDQYRAAIFEFTMANLRLSTDECRQVSETARLKRAESYHAMKQYKEAIEDYEWTIANGRIQDNIDMAYWNLGRCYYGLDNYKAALDHYEAYYKKYPASAKAAALYCEGRFLAFSNGKSREKKEDIVAFCKKALAQNPRDKAVQKVVSSLTSERSLEKELIIIE
jgi:tetratricopeptide (TPR) repeat protein